MKTPFDTALRVQQREVDTIRVSISVEVDRLGALQRAGEEQANTEARERATARELLVPCDAWSAGIRATRQRIADEARVTEARLAALRAQAAEVYGTMRAIEGAAHRHREDAERVLDAAEQTLIDDLAAIQFARARRTARERQR